MIINGKMFSPKPGDQVWFIAPSYPEYLLHGEFISESDFRFKIKYTNSIYKSRVFKDADSGREYIKRTRNRKRAEGVKSSKRLNMYIKLAKKVIKNNFSYRYVATFVSELGKYGYGQLNRFWRDYKNNLYNEHKSIHIKFIHIDYVTSCLYTVLNDIVFREFDKIDFTTHYKCHEYIERVRKELIEFISGLETTGLEFTDEIKYKEKHL